MKENGYANQLSLRHRLGRHPRQGEYGRYRAAPVAMPVGPQAGLDLIDDILRRGKLTDYHLAHAARADLCRKLGRSVEARTAHERVLKLAQLEPEQRFLPGARKRWLKWLIILTAPFGLPAYYSMRRAVCGSSPPRATVGSTESQVGSFRMATFVIVHGAWGGAWSWNKLVVPMLREAGQSVYAVTLTGLGERTHLASADVSLETHIQDVVNVLFYEDLTDVILVGHSYGGNIITGVADRVPERLQQLVYLDAATPADGQSSADSFPGRRQQLEKQARDSADGWTIPPGPVPPDQPAEITEWATPRRSPMPIKTMTSAVKLIHGETTVPRAFVYCTIGKDPGSPQAARAERIRNDPSWRFFELVTGHNLHYTAPAETVSILLELANARVPSAR